MIPRCVCCGRDVPQGEVCPDCAQALEAHEIFGEAAPGVYAAYRYSDAVGRLIHTFKYTGGRWMTAFLGDRLWRAVAALPVDGVSFVPLHKKRFAQRGYNQAQLLAERMARLSTKPCIDVLQRIRHTHVQARLPHEMRLENVSGAFSLCDHAGIQGLHILLVDDVITTGATISECKALLEEAGAAVTCAAFAVAGKSLQFVGNKV